MLTRQRQEVQFKPIGESRFTFQGRTYAELKFGYDKTPTFADVITIYGKFRGNGTLLSMINAVKMVADPESAAILERVLKSRAPRPSWPNGADIKWHYDTAIPLWDDAAEMNAQTAYLHNRYGTLQMDYTPRLSDTSKFSAPIAIVTVPDGRVAALKNRALKTLHSARELFQRSQSARRQE